MKSIIIGTRGSKLSLIQTNIVKDLLQAQLPQATIEITTIKTSGDKNMSPIPLDTIGKGWFTKEIDKQLLEGKIDLAVHSLKDLLDTLTSGLVITAIPQREDPAEALVSRNGLKLKKLRKGAVIGTDSIRRKMQILRMRHDLIVKSVRGNVNKRLEKLDSGEYDGLILAAAGLKRLGLMGRITEYFDPIDFIPSPGQGALAIVTKKDNKELNLLLSKLNHKTSIIGVTAEREFSKATGGGCSLPVGAYAKIKGKTLTLYGMLGSEDEKHMVKDMMSGNISNPPELAKQLADKLLQHSSHWQNKIKQKYVVLTREAKENETFAKQLKAIGLQPLLCPSITVSKNLLSKQFKKYIANISAYQWIIFTSANGVRFFMEGLREIEKNEYILKNICIAAVGKKTAETAKTYGLSVSFIPKTFTSKNLGKGLANLAEKRVLLPRSTIANEDFKLELEEKGAIATDMPVYTLELTDKKFTVFDKLLKENQILCLTFTSPSTMEGFLENINKNMQQKVLSLPVISIGPVTTKAAKRYGFKKIYTANTHTTYGMLMKIKQSIL